MAGPIAANIAGQAFEKEVADDPISTKPFDIDIGRDDSPIKSFEKEVAKVYYLGGDRQRSRWGSDD